MPELPEVETIRTALELQLRGQKITEVTVQNQNLRRPVDEKALRECCRGKSLEQVNRRGKYLIFGFTEDNYIVAHLGMTGGFRISSADIPLEKHEHVEWLLTDGRSLRYHDPRRFGCIVCTESSPIPGSWPLPKLGPEPLSDAFTVEYLYKTFKRHKKPVKNLLMEQQTAAGMGNIYASEALFRAGIDPRRSAHRISKKRCQQLQEAIRAVLTDAITCGGTTISDYRSLDGMEGDFAVCLDVYGKENRPCPRCGAAYTIKRATLGGRSTFYCSGCQH